METYLTILEVSELFQVGEATILAWSKSDQFPKPIRLSRRVLRWRQSDIDKHMAELSSRPEE